MSQTPFDSPFVLGAAQMCSGPDPAKNLADAIELMDAAADAGAELVVLPENALYLRIRDGELAPLHLPESAEVDALRARAAKHGIWLVVGSLSEDSGDPQRPYATSLVVDPSGATRGTYRKVHLFSLRGDDGRVLLDERRTVTPGDEPVVCETPLARLGLSICYDLRFPELYRTELQLGADVLLVPAAFTAQTGPPHWEVLLRARAIENQRHVVAAAQWGRHGGKRHSHGHTLIIDPWGVVLAERAEGVGVVTARIDPADRERARRNLQVTDDRRLGLEKP